MLKQSLLASILFALALPAFSETISTRFGSLEINDKVEEMGNEVLYQKKPLKFEDEDSGFFSVKGNFQIKNSDVLLIENDGALGASCPAQFYFVTISNSGTKVTKAFGSCSDVIREVKQIGTDSISITMQDFEYPKQNQTFTYKDGKVTEVKKKK